MATNSLLRLSICALLPGAALAQEPAAEHWDVRAAVYGFFPDIAGTTRFPVQDGEIDIEAHDLIDNTELAGMASIEAQKGRIGLFADAIYMNVGDELVGATTLAQGAIPLPPGVTADAALDIEASVWSVADSGRVNASITGRFPCSKVQAARNARGRTFFIG